MQIAAGKFKAQCLKLMDEVQRTRRAVVITKRGKVVAKLVPAGGARARTLWGCMKGAATARGNLVAPTGEKWDAEG